MFQSFVIRTNLTDQESEEKHLNWMQKFLLNKYAKNQDSEKLSLRKKKEVSKN